MNLMQSAALADLFNAPGQFKIFDDFTWYVTAHNWTSLAADTNTTVSVGDAAGGILALFTGDATDNNEVGVKSTAEVFKFAANKPLVCEARIQFTEINTSAANIAFGFADAIGANLLVDDGAGPKTTMSGALIFKVDGGTVWKTISSKSTTQTISTSTTTAGGASYQTLRIEARPVDSTTYEVTYYVDGQPLRDSNNKQIKDRLTLTSATEMQVGAYAKAGGTGQLTLNVDYIFAAQAR